MVKRWLNEARLLDALLGGVIVMLLFLDVVDVLELCCDEERDFSSDSSSPSSSSIRSSKDSDDARSPPLYRPEGVMIAPL